MCEAGGGGGSGGGLLKLSLFRGVLYIFLRTKGVLNF